MTKNDFQVGEPAEFVYHDKARFGVVDVVGENHVCVKVEGFDPDPAIKFKSFNYNKMQQVQNVVVQ